MLQTGIVSQKMVWLTVAVAVSSTANRWMKTEQLWFKNIMVK